MKNADTARILCDIFTFLCTDGDFFFYYFFAAIISISSRLCSLEEPKRWNANWQDPSRRQSHEANNLLVAFPMQNVPQNFKRYF